MSVWDRLGDAEVHTQLLMHPAHASVSRAIASHITEVRAISSHDEMRAPQEHLLGSLVTAERRYAEASRLAKRGSGDPVDLLFWRMACVRLRAVGDAIAWKFLAFKRAWIVLLAQNQRPGHLLGKAGSIDEWIRVIDEQTWLEGDAVTDYAGTGPLITDDRPRPEYFLLRRRFGIDTGTPAG